MEVEDNENFDRLWQQICSVHNQQLAIISTLIKMHPTTGIRLLLGRDDVVAAYNGEALLVAACKIVTPTEILWDNKIGNTCYALTPVKLENETWFIQEGSNELVRTSAIIKCHERATNVFRDLNGSWRSVRGPVQVDAIIKHLLHNPDYHPLTFHAPSVFELRYPTLQRASLS